MGSGIVLKVTLQFEVNSSIITVKFKSSITESQKTSFNRSQDVQVVRVNILGYYDLKIPENGDPLTILQKYLDSGLVETAEPNTYGSFGGEPNDPKFSDQWFHKHADDYDIDTPDFWDVETGDPGVVIAVLDNGTDKLHEDLKGNIWVNPGEDLDRDGVVWDSDDMNGVDDDGNGKVDDLVGWDFHNNINDVENYNVGTKPYHGTHVAGVAGAVTNNNKGIAGVAGGWFSASGSKMLICSVGGAVPDESVLDDAILYAAQSGVDIITMSLGFPDPNSAINAAIATAHNTYGVFLDCASMNEQSDVKFPANAEYVFAVGATDKNGVRAWFSNFGDGLDATAPGVDIWSTRKNHSYNTGDGTSFASPQAAGIAALLLAFNSSFTNIDLEAILARSAIKDENIFSEDQNLLYGAWNNLLGYGRLNARQALLLARAYDNKSIDNDATTANNGRRLVRDGSGNYHMVFTSGGEIFYRKNTGGSWEAPQRLSIGNGDTKYPCITEYSGKLYAVWEHQTNDSPDIYFTTSQNGGNSWSLPYVLVSPFSEFEDVKPVIQSNVTSQNSIVVVYKDAVRLKSMNTTNPNPSNINDWQSTNIPNTIGGSVNSSVAGVQHYWNGSSITGLAYEKSGTIYYNYFDPNSGSSGSWSGTTTNLSAIVPGNATHETPSLSGVPNSSSLHVAWHRVSGSGSSPYDHTVIHRKSGGFDNNSWGNQYTQVYYYNMQSPSISAVSSSRAYLVFKSPLIITLTK